VALRTVGVRLTADVSQYMSNLKRAGAATKDFTGGMDKAAKAGNLDAVADRAGVAGLALAGMAGYAIKSAADFDKAMSGVKAATHAGTQDIAALRQAALQAGKDTTYSATEAAGAVTELSKAGVSTADVLGGGLKGALSLAAAGQLDVGEAAETAASAMTQFKLSGKDIPHIADLLAAGAGKAQGSVHDMGYALSQSGLVASQFGLSIEDTTGTLAAFASAGLIGSDAGTSFKTMLLALANPAEKTKDAMDELGISAYDAQGKFVGITNLAEQLKTKLGGLTQAQRDQTLAQIFGSDAIRAANVLYQQGGKGIQDWIGKVNDAGYASQTAADLTDNLAGDIERLKGSIETLAIESGSGANGGLRVLVQSVEQLVDRFGRMPSAVSSSLVVLAGVGGAVLLALAAFIKLRKGLAEAVAQLNMMGPAGERAATGLSRVASAAGKAFAALAVLEVVGTIADHFGAASANVDRLTSSLTNYADTGKTAGELSDIFGNNLKDLGKNAQAADAATHGFWGGLNDLTSSIPGVNSLVDTLNERIYGLSFNQATDNMTALDQALTDFMTTTGDAKKSSELWNQVLQKSGLDSQQLADLLPNAYKKIGELNTAADKGGTALNGMATGAKGAAGAAGDLATATGPATTETKKYANAADAAAGAARGQRTALTELSTFMKSETDPVFGFIEAQRTLATAQKDAKTAQENLDTAISQHGPRSKEARAATEKLNTATRTLATAAVDLQGKTGDLGQAFDGKLSPSLIATFKAAGLTAPQIKILEGQFKNAKTAADAYDGKYEAKASAPGAVTAKQQMADAWAQAKGFEGNYQAKLTLYGDKTVDSKLADLLIKQRALATGLSYSSARSAVQKDLDRNRQKGYHAGGWTGPGSKYEPAGVVHADEFVIRKESRRKIEAQSPGMLEEMNATGQVPGYVLGGRVAWTFPTNVSKTEIPSWDAVASKVGGNFGNWPSSPGAQRGDSGVWRKILALVKASGIPYEFGNAYRPGDPLWHGSGRAIDFMGYNQDRLANFFLARQSQVLELIHRTKSRDYGITRGHYNAMPHQWPLHRNHLHIAMKNGGTITEPVMGVGASGRTYSFGENYQSERVIPNWHAGGGGGAAGNTTVINLTVPIAAGANPVEHGRQIAQGLKPFLDAGGTMVLQNGTKVF
jgi:TP901 family phage tail tape measure protein